MALIELKKLVLKASSENYAMHRSTLTQYNYVTRTQFTVIQMLESDICWYKLSMKNDIL